MSKKKNLGLANPLAALGSVLLLAACGMGSAELRGSDGKLAPCDGGPHCVSSLTRDPDRRVEPFHYSGKREEARQALLRVLRNSPGAAVVAESADYIHAEFTSPLLRYVDDVEFVFLSAENLIHVRSASRIGYYDFNANRERIEQLRLAFFQLFPSIYR